MSKVYIYEKNNRLFFYQENDKSPIILTEDKQHTFTKIYYQMLKNYEKVLKTKDHKDIVLITKDDTIIFKDYKKIERNFNTLSDALSKTSKIYQSTHKTKRKVNHTKAKIAIKVIIAITVSSIAINKVMPKTNAVNNQPTEKNKIPAIIEEVDEQPTQNNEIIIEDTAYQIDEKNKQQEIKQQPNNFNIELSNATINSNFTPRFNTDRSINAQNYFTEIKTVANKYMLDENLVLAIATEERGTHTSEINQNGMLGLMQISTIAHPDASTLNVYQLNNNNIEKTNFAFYQSEYQTLEGNIEAGCALLQYYIEYFHGNLSAAILAYNSGQAPIDNAIYNYSIKTNQTFDEVQNNYSNISWADSLDNKEYLTRVLSWLNTDNIKVNYITTDNDNILDNNIIYGIVNEKELSINENIKK